MGKYSLLIQRDLANDVTNGLAEYYFIANLHYKPLGLYKKFHQYRLQNENWEYFWAYVHEGTDGMPIECPLHERAIESIDAI